MLPPVVPEPSYPRGLGPGRRPGGIPPPAPVPAPGTQETPDFSRIDFDRLWAGRGKVTEVEGAILARAVAEAPPGRVVEVGAGGGRLTPYLARLGREVVSSDATLALLRSSPWGGGRAAPRIGANVYRLPFRDGEFAAATLVRVFGFLSDPSAALREIRRVLRTDGVLVLSFEPHPSLGSLVDDLKVGLARPTASPGSPRSFSREGVVPVRPSAYPAWSHTRSHLRALADEAGYRWETEFPCGLEDLAGLRRLPSSVFVGLSRALSGLGGFPTRIVLLRRVG